MTTELTILVLFGEQSKKINVRPDATIEDVEKKVLQAYGFEEEDFRPYQIQYYDHNFQQHVDLDATCEIDLKNLLSHLSSESKPSQSDPSWRLKIIPKTIKRKHSLTEQPLHSDEIYQFQQTNENRSDDLLNKPKKRRPKRSTSEPVLFNNQTLITTKDSSYHLKLNFLLEPKMRSQYERDVFPSNKEKQTDRIAGVLMATKHFDVSDRLSNFDDPAAFFRIPSDMIKKKWSIWFFIVLESHADEQYYINKWKGIYYHPRDVKHKSSDAKNPLEKTLTYDNLRDEFLLLPLKICSFNCKKQIETGKTRLLPTIGHRLSTDDDLTSDEKVYGELKVNWHQFRLAVLLVCDEEVVDRCISNSSSANPKRGRKSS